MSQPEFEGWLAPDLARLAGCVDRLLDALRRARRATSTASSSPAARRWCPAVRRLFAERFGAERLRGGEELTTVASGLALIAAER